MECWLVWTGEENYEFNDGIWKAKVSLGYVDNPILLNEEANVNCILQKFELIYKNLKFNLDFFEEQHN